KDGVKRTSVEVNVDKLDLIGGRSDGQQGGGAYAPAASAAPQSNGGFPTHGGQAPAQATRKDPFADSPSFNNAPVDDDIPF
ncbi:MAG: hypothetical protein Q9M18_06345, partial [Mariprofundaceae bacterium]|nr:hypothetical protein [Mariprofundaceae bacterium]